MATQNDYKLLNEILETAYDASPNLRRKTDRKQLCQVLDSFSDDMDSEVATAALAGALAALVGIGYWDAFVIIENSGMIL